MRMCSVPFIGSRSGGIKQLTLPKTAVITQSSMNVEIYNLDEDVEFHICKPV